jgi:hypothetical protein
VLGDMGRAQILKDAARDGSSALCNRLAPTLHLRPESALSLPGG